MHECTHTHPHIVDGLKRQDFSDHLKDASMLVFDDLTSVDLCVYCCYYCVDISTILCALFYQLFVLHVCAQFCIYCLCFMFLFGALCTVVVKWVLMLHVCVHQYVCFRINVYLLFLGLCYLMYIVDGEGVFSFLF